MAPVLLGLLRQISFTFTRIKNSLPRFILKLQEKKQTPAQQEQASTAITFLYEIQNKMILPVKVVPPQPVGHPAAGYPALVTFNEKSPLSIREVPADQPDQI